MRQAGYILNVRELSWLKQLVTVRGTTLALFVHPGLAFLEDSSSFSCAAGAPNEPTPSCGVSISTVQLVLALHT